MVNRYPNVKIENGCVVIENLSLCCLLSLSIDFFTCPVLVFASPKISPFFHPNNDPYINDNKHDNMFE
jgi:hypothetical protein